MERVAARERVLLAEVLEEASESWSFGYEGSWLRWFVRLGLSAFFLCALSGCIVFPPKDNSSYKGAPIVASDQTTLAKMLDPVTETRSGETGAYLLTKGSDAFLARIAMIEMAEESIVAQYYIFENDVAGRIFLARLLAAADRGVKVRLLVDDLAKTWKDRYLAAAVMHPNFEMSLFNPPVRIGRMRPVKALARFTRIHRRMHNKEMVVDGRIAIIGGRNIGDGYFGNSDKAIADIDIVVIGDEVKELLRIFNEYWEYALSVPVESVASKRWLKQERYDELRAELLELNQSEEALAFVHEMMQSPFLSSVEERRIPFWWSQAETLVDDPEKLSHSRYNEETHMAPELKKYLDDCRSDLVLISPYFIPGKGGVKTLTDLADRGIDIAVVTNGIGSSDHSLVHSSYSKYRKALLEHGVTLFETKSSDDEEAWSLLHVKLFLLDQRYVMIGSYNLDPRSNKLNTELMMVFENPEFAESIMAKAKLEFDGKLWRLNLTEDGSIEWEEEVEGQREILDTEPGTTWFKRQKLKMLRLLPIEGQL